MRVTSRWRSGENLLPRQSGPYAPDRWYVVAIRADDQSSIESIIYGVFEKRQ
jgi:hypothetical protein